MESQIRLIVAEKQGRSYIRSLYTSPPFRVVSVGQLAHDNGAYLMIMSTSPGILSGDKYDINIEVEPCARVMLKSQSYQRLYDMDQHAEQRMEIKVGDGAHFSQVSHPIVPHRNSALFSSTSVTLGSESSFLQSEIITCGRKHHGEEFEFREFHNSVEVRHAGVLRLKDRVWLAPKSVPLTELGLLEGATHQASLIYQTTTNQDIPHYIETIYEMLSTYKGIRFGISQSHYPGFVIRLLGDGGEKLYDALCQVQEIMWSTND